MKISRVDGPARNLFVANAAGSATQHRSHSRLRLRRELSPGALARIVLHLVLRSAHVPICKARGERNKPPPALPPV
jgi:hypothetical protein